jgi:glycosyltransferase involved in cell wall biosynthesis
MEPVRISAVIITYNESRNIARCIESLANVADEVLVMDSGSTDDTVALSKMCGAVVHTHPFDNFAAQKNRAAALATYDLILSLDADEALSPELQRSMAATKVQPVAGVWRIQRITQYCGRWIRHGGWYPDVKPRLYDRRYARWEGGRVHESLGIDAGVPVYTLQGHCLHYSFHSVAQHMDTVTRYARLKAEDMHACGHRTRMGAMLTGPLIHLVKQYIFKAGFLDGWQGLVIAINSAHGVFLKHAMLRDLHRGD